MSTSQESVRKPMVVAFVEDTLTETRAYPDVEPDNLMMFELAGRDAEDFIRIFEPLIDQQITVDYTEGVTCMQLFAANKGEVPPSLRNHVKDLYEVTVSTTEDTFLFTLPPEQSAEAVERTERVLQGWKNR